MCSIGPAPKWNRIYGSKVPELATLITATAIRKSVERVYNEALSMAGSQESYRSEVVDN